MITGQCLCGTVRFEVDGNVSDFWLCHCSKCRFTGGGPFTASALCRRDAFRWLSGEETLTRFRSASGYTTTFCGRCGSPAPLVSARGSRVVVPVGTLGAEYRGRLRHHIFVGSRAAWWTIDDDAPCYDEHVPGTSAAD